MTTFRFLPLKSEQILKGMLIRLFLILCSVSLSTELQAALTAQDDADLTHCLEELSGGWIWPSIDLADAIFSRSEYSAQDWEIWFDNYFNSTGHPYTNDLENFLRGPVFFWFNENESVRLKLQIGLIVPMWNKASGIVIANQDHLGTTLYEDVDTRQSIFNAHLFFTNISKYGLIDETARTTIYQHYQNHILAFPRFFSNSVTIDVVAQPLVALLRAQVWAVCGDTLPLTEVRKSEIAQTIDLSGKKRDIWDLYGMLIIDNNQLDNIQLNITDTLLSVIPAQLTNLRFITVRDFLQYPYDLPIVQKGQTGGVVNYYFWINEGRIVNSFDGAPGSWIGPTSSQPIKWDNWNHVAATYDGATMRVYLNGEESNSMAAAGNPVNLSSEPLRIGRMPDFNLWMRGTLDEVKIYNRLLSSEEILQEYQMQNVSTTDLLCYWNMDETQGEIIADASGLGHHGQNTGAVSVAGKVGNALFFDGINDQVIVEDTPDLRLNHAMTLEAWVFIRNEWPKVFPGSSEMVNNFAGKVDQVIENSFPDDIAPRMVSTFCVANCHEYNHVVDAFTIRKNPVLQNRLMLLIAQAGTDPMQYLRSMFFNADGTSVFPDGPQEFFASISNEYFTDTWHTLELGLSRFDRGYKEPINQFLFFADIYSLGGLSTKVYTMDTAGQITVDSASLGRNASGYINRLKRGNTIYHFTLDDNGNVSAWQMSQSDLCPQADLTGNCLVDLNDLMILITHWLDTSCQLDDCQGADLTQDTRVDQADFVLLAQNWLDYSDLCPKTDLTGDCSVDLNDLMIFVFYWLDPSCQFVDCQGADLTQDKKVDLADFAIFAQSWLEGIPL